LAIERRHGWLLQLAFGNRKLPMKLVAVEGIEPTSLDYQSSALAVELHRGNSFGLRVSSFELEDDEPETRNSQLETYLG
jgi:hypothetical protein